MIPSQSKAPLLSKAPVTLRSSLLKKSKSLSRVAPKPKQGNPEGPEHHRKRSYQAPQQQRHSAQRSSSNGEAMSKEETTTAASARVQAEDVVDDCSRHVREVATGEDARINILGSANNFADETNFGQSMISSHGVNFLKKNALGGDCDKTPLS